MIGKLTSAEQETFHELLESEMTVTELMIDIHLATRERAVQIVESLCFVGRTPETQRIVDKFKSDVLKALREADYTEALRKAGTK
jgi:hypothetical protein